MGGLRALDGVFAGGKIIYARYKGVDYKAWVNKRGRIRLSHNGERFDTPSGAGAAVREEKVTNGWRFWKLKQGKGEFAPLSSMCSK